MSPENGCMELTEFLLERIAEDEALARDALHPDANAPGSWITEHHNSEYHSEPNRAHIAEDRSGHYWSVAHEVFIPIAEHVARHDPARVLADCEAKRGLILDAGEVPTTSMRRCLKCLALPYADHPDYDKRWRP